MLHPDGHIYVWKMYGGPNLWTTTWPLALLHHHMKGWVGYCLGSHQGVVRNLYCTLKAFNKDAMCSQVETLWKVNCLLVPAARGDYPQISPASGEGCGERLYGS